MTLLLKWTLAKRRMIVQKYGTPSEHASHNARLSDVHQSDADIDATGAGPSEMECTYEYDDIEASGTFSSVPLSASTPPGP
jgi:hypothetical protein